MAITIVSQSPAGNSTTYITQTSSCSFYINAVANTPVPAVLTCTLQNKLTSENSSAFTNYSIIRGTELADNTLEATINYDAGLAGSKDWRYVVTGEPNAPTIGDTFKLVVAKPPQILEQPVSQQSVLKDTDVVFSIDAEGDPQPTYQWYKVNSEIIVGTTRTLTLRQVQTNLQVYCVVSNLAGNVASNVASVTVEYAPVFTAQPVGAYSVDGGSVSFNVEVNSNPAAALQWYLDDVAVGNAVQSTFIVNAPNAAADVYCIATNTRGTARSVTVRLMVRTKPTITTQPINIIAVEGSTATFNVGAQGTPTPTYQWYYDSNKTAIAGAVGDTLTLNNVTNNTSVYCAVTNIVSQVLSNTVQVTVQRIPVIRTQPESVSVVYNGTANIFIEVDGIGPFTYQWFQDDFLTNQETSNFVVDSVISKRRYYCKVTNAAGSVVSNTVIIEPTSISPLAVLSVTAQDVPIGVSVPVTVTVLSGTEPLIYDWYLNDTKQTLTNNSSTYTVVNLISSVTLYCSVSNVAGVSDTSKLYLKAVPFLTLERDAKDNQILTYSSRVSSWIATTPASRGVAIFDAAGVYSWIAPEGVGSVEVSVYSAGGGGGSAAYQGTGGGGGAGAFAMFTIAVTGGVVYTDCIIVGAGGLGGVNVSAYAGSRGRRGGASMCAISERHVILTGGCGGGGSGYEQSVYQQTLHGSSVKVSNNFFNVVVPSRTSEPRGDFTVECWVKFTSSDITSDCMLFSTSNLLNVVITSQRKLSLQWVHTTKGVRKCTTLNDIPCNIWCHVAVSVDAGYARLYIDGVSQVMNIKEVGYSRETIETGDNGDNKTSLTQPFRVCGAIESTTTTFKGSVCNFRVLYTKGIYKEVNITLPTKPFSSSDTTYPHFIILQDLPGVSSIVGSGTVPVVVTGVGGVYSVVTDNPFTIDVGVNGYGGDGGSVPAIAADSSINFSGLVGSLGGVGVGAGVNRKTGYITAFGPGGVGGFGSYGGQAGGSPSQGSPGRAFWIGAGDNGGGDGASSTRSGAKRGRDGAVILRW